jgi:hypothetical protein
VPRPLSDLVARLLAKSADERYQSAWGVAADLAWCLESLTSFGRIDPFELGQHDVSSRFRLPEILYGREVELGQLLEAFELCVDGGKAMVTVAGYSGIGKTSIVLEMQRPVVERRGWFCTGKFDQFTRDVPYTAVAQAIEDLVRQVRMRPLPVVEALRNAVLDAVGPNGGVLVEVVPELERLIGSVPPPPVLGPAEAQIRFHRVVLQFVRVFARREHPLVLFLDDLQWADVSSLRLLERLGTDPGARNVLLVGAWRDHEVGEGHPLRLTLAALDDADLRAAIIARYHAVTPCITIRGVRPNPTPATATTKKTSRKGDTHVAP